MEHKRGETEKENNKPKRKQRHHVIQMLRTITITEKGWEEETKGPETTFSLSLETKISKPRG